MARIVPAVLPTSREDLEQKLAIINAIPGVDRVQIDAVDGRFASPASWPYSKPHELEELIGNGWMLPELDRIAYEVDLMGLDAETVAGAWLDLGVTRLTFHLESLLDAGRFLAGVRKRYGESGFTSLVSFGLATNLGTDPALLEPYLDEISYVQFMGIARIGRQGQPFDRRVVERIRAFRARHPDIPVQVDGGVDRDTVRPLRALGVSDLIVGSALLRASDPAAAFAALEDSGSAHH